MTINLEQGVWNITLTQAAPEQELILTNLADGVREFILGGNLDGGAYVKLQRWMGDFIGYADMLNISADPKTVFKADVLGAGYGFATYHRAGKIKFVLVGGTGTTNTKISFLQ